MKKLYLKIAVALLFLMTNSGLFAQLIVEDLRTIPGSHTHHYLQNFDGNSYTQISEENGRKIYAPDFLNNQNNSPIGEEGINDVTLNINLLFDPDQYVPSIIFIYNEEGYFNLAFYQGTNPVTVSVPPGTYDIFTDFRQGSKAYFVIKELVEVAGSMSIDVDVQDADNHITMGVYNEEGEILEPGVINMDTGEVTGGNAAEVDLIQSIILDSTDNPIITSLFGWPFMFSENEEPMWNFFINDVSERYIFSQVAFASGHEKQHYYTRYNTLNGVSQSVSLENNPENYIFQNEHLQPSPLAEQQENIYMGPSVLYTFKGTFRQSWAIFEYTSENEYTLEEGFKIWLNNPIDDDPTGLLMFPIIIDYMRLVYPDPENYPDWVIREPYFMEGDAIMTTPERGVLYGSGAYNTKTSFSLGFNFYNTETNAIEVLPFHPRFSFSDTEMLNNIQGNNVPISVLAFENKNLKTMFMGGYGEVRYSDFFATQVEVKRDGNIVFSGNYMEDGFLDYTFPDNGNIEMTFNNSNTIIDGLVGENITKLYFDKANEDSAPPTLQHLQFRNANDKVTDRFVSASEGTVRLAAGDFRFTELNEFEGYYVYIPGSTVEFYYSPYNQDNWAEIQLTNYPEYFQMPAFGDYYEASLASVIVPEENSWFDVKIVCTDAAGNKQEQVISPAFKVEQSNMGTNEVNPPGLAVYPNPFTNEIKIKLPEYIKGNYDFKVSDITGKTIYRKNQNERSFVWNGSSLPKGIYILSIESNGKTIAKKVVKK